MADMTLSWPRLKRPACACRHACATHLLEHHEDIRVIQVLLGHKKLENTARYSQVAAKLLHEVKGPLEYLNIRPPV